MSSSTLKSRRESLAAFLHNERDEIAVLTAGMPPETAAPYFERIDILIAEHENLLELANAVESWRRSDWDRSNDLETAMVSSLRRVRHE